MHAGERDDHRYRLIELYLGANDWGVLVGSFNFFSGGLIAIPIGR